MTAELRNDVAIRMPRTRTRCFFALAILLVLYNPYSSIGQTAPSPNGKVSQKSSTTEKPAELEAGRYPELVDITDSTGIQFEHVSSSDQKFIVESMSGGVALIDYDRDGWLDIYFTNAQTVEMALNGKKARSALYRNNHDGTFTDVSDKAGVAYPCWAMGASVGDYNNDGWPDMLVTCFGGMVYTATTKTAPSSMRRRAAD